jgi:O-antigen ligase
LTTGKAHGVSLTLAPALLAAMLLAIGLVPDEAVLRPKVAWTEALALAAFGAAILRLGWRAEWRLPWPAVVVAGLLPSAWGLAWVLGPGLPSQSLAVDEVSRIALVTLVFWTTAVGASTAELRRLCFGALVLVTVPVAALAVGQSLSGILDLPLARSGRASSTFGNPVFLGAFLVLSLPACAAAALFGAGLLRWAGALATGLALPALLATQSRWAWLGAAAGMVTGIVLLVPERRSRRVLLAGLCMCAVAVAALSRQVLLRPQNHALIWRDTVQMVAAHPWGVGPGQFPLAFLPWASPELLAAYPRSAVIINDAHCEPLQILAELGWPGLLTVLAWLTLLVRACLGRLRTMAAGDPERPCLVAIVSALAGSVVQSLGSPDLRFLISSLLFATLAGLAAAMDTPSHRAGRARLPARLAMGLAGLAALGWAGHGMVEHAELASMVRPADPAPPTTEADRQKLLDLLAQVKQTPEDPEAHYNLGVALAGTRRYHEAAVALRTAAVLSEGRATVVRSLGVVEGMGGEFAPAVQHLRAALEVYPEDAELHYLLAYSAYGLGDIATAIAELERLLAAHPGHRRGELLLEKLRE